MLECVDTLDAPNDFRLLSTLSLRPVQRLRTVRKRTEALAVLYDTYFLRPEDSMTSHPQRHQSRTAGTMNRDGSHIHMTPCPSGRTADGHGAGVCQDDGERIPPLATFAPHNAGI